MEFKSLLIVLLISIQTRMGICHIQINAESPAHDASYTVRHAGTASNIINRQERDLFGLSDSELLRCGQNHFGVRPTSIFLHDPTAWGFKYNEYRWAEVRCHLAVVNAQLVPVSTGQMLIASANLTNSHEDIPADYLIRLTGTTSNRVSNSWMGTTSVNLEKTIRYGLSFAGGQFSFSTMSSWGEGQTTEQQVTVEMASEKRITLEPGERARIEMFVTRNNVRLDINYLATLSGNAFVNFARRHEGHHFWGISINSLLRAGGISTSLISSESISVGYATEGQVRVTNLNSRKVEVIPVVIKMKPSPQPTGITTVVCNKQ